MSKIEVNTVDVQCGSTLTLGSSGKTVQLATGASQFGLGSPGQLVDWQTSSIKTSTFTATANQGFFCNTSGGAFTVNLPAGSAGTIIGVADYTRSFNSENLTINANGSEKIGGVDGPVVLSVNGQSAIFIYVDATEGWLNISNTEDSEAGKTEFIVATGGTITNSGNCRIHTFTSPGTFEVTCSATCSANNVLSYMVVAGGGGGGSGSTGGGGGAGGFREVKSPVTPYTASPLDGYSTPANRVTLPIGGTSSIPVTVGSGGAGATFPGLASTGSNSVFSTITAAGGGTGGSAISPIPSSLPGGNGGSGGGGGGHPGLASSSGGTGNTPPVSPAQGTNGGTGCSPSRESGGGGGGATVAGTNSGSSDNGGNGGTGATTEINASPVARAGGGGGGADGPAGSGGNGGTGGGGTGGDGPIAGSALGHDGTVNTGGGGGGSGCSSCGNNGGSGGSGIVIIRYKYQ